MINNPFVLIGDIPAPYFCDKKQFAVYDIFLRLYLNRISESV